MGLGNRGPDFSSSQLKLPRWPEMVVSAIFLSGGFFSIGEAFFE